MTAYRTEHDSLGEVRVPGDALFGPQTQRAVENFPVSGITFPRSFIKALGLVKAAAAKVNAELGVIDAGRAAAIRQASEEVAEGRWDDHFPLVIFQTGSGTSTNMNANEVIARRAAQLLDATAGPNAVHPNDHVNLGQSSNDVIPTAIHLSTVLQIREVLLPGLRHLEGTLGRRAAELDHVVKTGRTHLMDALPVRLGQEVGGWARQVSDSMDRIEGSLPRLCRLAIGGTAVGTGVNAHPSFGRMVAANLSGRTGIAFAVTEDHFAAQASMDAAAEMSGQVKTTASALLKIANDLRWMNSGPRAGLGEVTLPALQPGSSIMPGKVNPVICESLMMVCVQVMSNDLAVSTANALGNFELNAMLPLIAHNLLQSVSVLGNAARLFADRAVAGFTVNLERLSISLEHNPFLVTALNPVVGYDTSEAIARKAAAEGRAIKDVAAEVTGLSRHDLDRLLDPLAMTGHTSQHRDERGRQSGPL